MQHFPWLQKDLKGVNIDFRFSTALKLRSVSSKIPKTSTKESSKHNDPDDVESRERSASPRRRGHALKEKLRWSRRLNRKRCAITWAIVLLIGALIGLLVYYFNFVKYAEYYEVNYWMQRGSKPSCTKLFSSLRESCYYWHCGFKLLLFQLLIE